MGVTGQAMGESEIAYVGKKVLNALSYLHESNLLHNNIRSSNVLISTNGDIKIVGNSLIHYSQEQKRGNRQSS